MKWKRLAQVLPPLLCVCLCACVAAPAAGAVPAASVVNLSAQVESVGASSLTVELTAPTAWSRDSVEVAISVTDNTGSGFSSAEVKVGRDGSWRDITDTLRQSGSRYTGAVEVSDNGPVTVKATGHDGTVYEQFCNVACLDRTAPTVRAVADGSKLCIEARDNRSGIASILVDGKEYAASDEQTMSVTMDELDAGKEQVTVQAVDRAGNRSAVTTADNPNYQPPKEDTEQEPDTPAPSPTPTPVVTAPTVSATTKPSTTQQQTANSGQSVSTPTATEKGSTSVSGTSSVSASADPETEKDTEPRGDNALTPDGQGTVVDNTTEDEGKEFFTITTANDNVFYLIVDKQRDSENVYFLNAVTEEDLLALAEPSADDGETAVPDPEPVCTCETACEAGAVDTGCPVCVTDLERCTGTALTQPEEAPAASEQENGGTGSLVVIVLVVLAVGGAGYYFKVYKPKHELDDAEDFDELTGAEEETVNEDAEEPYPDEPDYPDYYDDEPEEPDDEAN